MIDGPSLETARWAVRLVFRMTPRLLAGLAVVAVFRGLLPAGLALVLRGLVNAAVRVTADGGTDLAPLVPWLVAGFALTIANALILQLHDYLDKRLRDELELKVVTRILSHATSLDLAFFEDPAKQDLLDRTRSEVPSRLAWFVGESEELATNVIRAGSLAGVLVAIEPLVLLVLPPFAVPLLFFQWRLARRRYAEEHGRTEERRWSEYYVDRLTGPYSVAEVKLLDLGPLLLRNFSSLMEGFMDRDRRLHRWDLRGSALTAGLTVAALYLLFVRVAARAVQGTVTLGDLAIFGAASSHLRQAIDDGIRSVAVIREQSLFIADLRVFLEATPRVKEPAFLPGNGAPRPTPARPASPGRGEIRLERVTFAYPGSRNPVLRDVSFRVRPGERLAIMGRNGVGKSTLAKLLLRLYDPDQGRILLDGVDLREIPRDELRLRIGFVLQSFGCYEGTAAENIAYGDWRRLLREGEGVDLQGVESLARACRIESLVEGLPQGYETLLGRTFGHHTLSRGEWQQLAVARALARDGDVLVLDEPTSNLDGGAESGLLATLQDIARERTTIVISHRFTTIADADRILVLEKGRILQEGRHQELLSRSGPYAALYALHERLQRQGAGARREAS